jgi:enoyl-CoA hydratase
MLLPEDLEEKMVRDFTPMQNNFETIKFDVQDSILTLTINRPTKMNALNIKVLQELKQFLTEIHNEKLKGLIITGEGERAFIAGADIEEMRSMTSQEAYAFSQLGQQVTMLFESLPFPSIAAVAGYALGGGFEIAMSCDFIFCTSSSVFGLPEVKLGLIPGFGGTVRLGRIIGERRAKEIIFSGRNISSQEAIELGISLQHFETKTELLLKTRSWLESTSQNSLHAISRAKHSMNLSSLEIVQHGLKMERETFGNIFQTPQMIEGTTAFLEKRKPHFTT